MVARDQVPEATSRSPCVYLLHLSIVPMTRPSFTLLCSMALCLPASAQNFFWDFEGPNGLDGWYRSDGMPLQTDAGFASLTSVKVTSDNSPAPKFIYHEVPYDATAGYLASAWTRALVDYSSDWSMHFAWLLPGPGATQVYWGGNAITGTTIADDWVVMEHADINTYPYGGTFCLFIIFSSVLPQDNWVDNVEVRIVPQNTPILSVEVMLGGPYDPVLQRMTPGLITTGAFPLVEPYTALGYPQFGGGGGETFIPGLLDPTIWWPNVDWVRIELRSAADPTVIVATRQALVDVFGSVRGPNGDMRFVFDVPLGEYYIAVRHRNHLACMSAQPKTFGQWNSLPGEGVSFEATTTATWGVDARKMVGPVAVLWPGDTNGDGTIKYAGANNDRDPVLVAIGGTVPTNVLSDVYVRTDVNMDGDVKYVGAGNDRDPILQSIGGIVPTLTRVQQLP